MLRPSLNIPVVLCLLLPVGAAAQSSRAASAAEQQVRAAKTFRLAHASAVASKSVSTVAHKSDATSALRAAYEGTAR